MALHAIVVIPPMTAPHPSAVLAAATAQELRALGAAYLLSGPGPALRRAGELAVAGVVLALVSVCWMTAISRMPPADRPYVDGSHDNSVFEQVFAYNGFGRFGDQTPVPCRRCSVPERAVGSSG